MRRHGNSGGSDDSGEDGGVGGWAVAAVLAAKGGVAETMPTKAMVMQLGATTMMALL